MRLRPCIGAMLLSVICNIQLLSSAHAEPPEADLSGVTFKTVETNGIKMHFAEQGAGPLVILCHGFPESWYSWRHQIKALANAGYRVVVPDQRGYGKTDRPEAIDQYTLYHLAGDIVGLVNALGEEQAVIVGHDWGAPVAWHCSLLRPDIFRATALLSVPYSPRRDGDLPPIESIRRNTPEGQVFYQVYFQEPGVADADFAKDVRRSILGALFSASGEAQGEQRWNPMASTSKEVPAANQDDSAAGDSQHQGAAAAEKERFPSWLSPADLDFFTQQFEQTGFTGGLNWYRNIDRNWRLSAGLLNAKLQQPTLFIAGDRDVVAAGFAKAGYEALEENVPNLTKKVLLPGIGHWTQQEAPARVNALLIEFLKSLE